MLLPRSGNRIALTLLAFALGAIAGCGPRGTRPVAEADPISEAAAAPSVAGAEAPVGGLPMGPPVEVPERAMADYTRALDAMYAGNWFEAEVGLEQLILEYSSYPGPYVNLSILYRRDNRMEEAEDALSSALAIVPDHPVANSELGVLLRERGDFEAAEAAYRRAIEGDPSYALAHYNLGVLYDLYLKREADALEQYETYLSLMAEPDPEVQRWVVDLKRRLGIPTETAQVAQENGT